MEITEPECPSAPKLKPSQLADKYFDANELLGDYKQEALENKNMYQLVASGQKWKPDVYD